jgi:hypothetical protein
VLAWPPGGGYAAATAALVQAVAELLLLLPLLLTQVLLLLLVLVLQVHQGQGHWPVHGAILQVVLTHLSTVGNLGSNIQTTQAQPHKTSGMQNHDTTSMLGAVLMTFHDASPS